MQKAAETVAVQLNVNAERPLQAQLFEQVRAMILDGQLKGGSPLPASRALSEQLGISRNTVVLAYERLLSEGYIESKQSIGTFVTEAVPEGGLTSSPKESLRLNPQLKSEDTSASVSQIVAKHFEERLADEALTSPSQPMIAGETLGEDLVIDFCPQAIDPLSFPERSWRRLYNRKSTQVERYAVDHDTSLGLYDLRRAIADHLGPARGMIVSPDEVAIVGSIQEGRALLAQLLLAKTSPSSLEASVGIMEAPGPLGMALLFQFYQSDIHSLEVDQDGMRTDLLNEISIHDVKGQGMIYVTPSQHHSLGTLMPLARRLELLAWANKAGLMIVEDETDSEFRYEGAPVTALKGLDSKDCVLYLGGFEKVMGHGLGLGFIVFPSALGDAIKCIKATQFPGPLVLEQATMAEFLESGAYDRHLRKVKKVMREKRDHLIQTLHHNFGDIDLYGKEGGLQVAWRLPKELGLASDIVNLAEQNGMKLYTVTSPPSFTDSPSNEMKRMLIFGYGALSLDEITDGIKRLNEFLSQSLKASSPKKQRKVQATASRLKTDLGVTG